MRSTNLSSEGACPGGGGLRIALTRAASSFGTVLAEHLVAAGDEVVGLDTRAGRSGSVEWRPVTLASPTVVQALDDVDVLVHLAWDPNLSDMLAERPTTRRARVLDETRTLTTAAAAAGVGQLVVVTSAMVLGARPDNPVPLPEDWPLRAPETEGVVADLVAVEEELGLLGELHPGLRTTVVRPTALVGEGVDTMITRHFEAPRLLSIRGTTPAWSFCHAEDLASALRTVAHGDLPSPLSVGSRGTLTQQELERLSGMRRIEVTAGTAQATAERLHRLGVIPVPATDLAYISHPWTSEPLRLLEHGWTPAHDNADCLAVLLESVRGHHALMARRLRSRDAVGAAAGAASAGVAVIATAALMRRRRRRD